MHKKEQLGNSISRMKDKTEGRSLNDVGKILWLREDHPIKKTRKENWLFETNKSDNIMWPHRSHDKKARMKQEDRMKDIAFCNIQVYGQ